jgi:hypothetical protein
MSSSAGVADIRHFCMDFSKSNFTPKFRIFWYSNTFGGLHIYMGEMPPRNSFPYQMASVCLKTKSNFDFY